MSSSADSAFSFNIEEKAPSVGRVAKPSLWNTLNMVIKRARDGSSFLSTNQLGSVGTELDDEMAYREFLASNRDELNIDPEMHNTVSVGLNPLNKQTKSVEEFKLSPAATAFISDVGSKSFAVEMVQHRANLDLPERPIDCRISILASNALIAHRRVINGKGTFDFFRLLPNGPLFEAVRGLIQAVVRRRALVTLQRSGLIASTETELSEDICPRWSPEYIVSMLTDPIISDLRFLTSSKFSKPLFEPNEDRDENELRLSVRLFLRLTLMKVSVVAGILQHVNLCVGWELRKASSKSPTITSNIAAPISELDAPQRSFEAYKRSLDQIRW